MGTYWRVRSILVAIILTAGSRTGSAQGPVQPVDPTGTVRAFWAAVLAMRWADAVDLLDLRELEAVRKAQIASARSPRGREYTAEDLMRRDPEMPREAAEYEVRRQAKLRALVATREFSGYFGVDSAGQLERMPIEEVAVRWIQAHDPIWVSQEERRVHRCVRSVELDSIAANRRSTVYHAVMAGPDTAYVLFRPAWLPFPREVLVVGYDPAPLRIASVLRTSSGWRIRAVNDLVEGSVGTYGMADCRSRR